MSETKKAINIFKPYLSLKQTYKGGITKGELTKSGKKIYKLSSNENILGSSPLALEAIKNNLSALNEYPDRTDERLRNQLHHFYKEELSPEHFIGGPSGSEVLDLTIRAFMDHDLECIVSNPFFLPYQMFSQWLNAKIIDIPMNPDSYEIDADAILAAITDKTRLLFLTSPNNPTGTYIPKATLEKIIYNVPDHVVIVMDEVYYHFADAEDFTTALPYVKEGKKIIALNSFSKAFGLASMRIGYAYTTPEISAYIRQISKPFLINRLSLEAAIAALKDEAFLKLTRETIIGERKWLYHELDQLGIQYWKSQANFILIQPPIQDDHFAQAMLSAGVMVRPSANFGSPGNIRVTIGDREANVAYINAIKSIIKES
jgi:histidinol-phosphate aminotransferase